MTRTPTLILVAVTVGIAVVGTLMWFWSSALDLSSDSDADYDLLQTVATSSGKRVATIYTQSGGGALGYCYRCVSVQSPDTDAALDPRLAAPHTVFVGNCGGAVRVKWLDELHLEITYSGQTFTQNSKSTDDAVVISYVRSSSPGVSSNGNTVSANRAPN
jgi:hypothetical protein